MELKNEKIISRLISRGVEFRWDYEYVGEGDERKRVERPDRVRQFFAPLTAEEWCGMCMREGDEYIGGCCGQTGYTQDVLNEIFRDGGWIEPRLALDLIEIGGGHDGFDLLTEQDEDKLIAEEANWDTLGGLGKIFLCVAAAAPRICPNWLSKIIPPNREESNDGIGVLFNAIQVLKYGDLFGSDEAKESGQHHGNMMMWLARAVPGIEKFRKHTKATLAEEPWNGFAIVSHENEIQRNGYGYTIYSTKDAAERMVQMWHKQDAEAKDDKKNEEINTITIKPVQVSSEGIIIL
jgi:hypothetical protein